MAEETRVRGEVLRTRDFIGRDVIDPQGEKVGKIGDVLIDRQSGTVRFLDLDFGMLRRHHALVPVEQIEWGTADFMLGHWTDDEIKALPPYDAEQPLTGDVLDEMARSYPRFYGSADDQAPIAAPGDSTVVPLKEAKDFQLSKDAPNLRGWNVFGADGERVGTVSEMLVDPGAMKVRYLDVDLLDDLFLLKDDRHVIVPTEAIDPRERGKDVWIAGLPAAAVARLPAYTGGTVDPRMEAAVRDAFAGDRDRIE